MRVSVDPRDPGFRPDAIRYEAYLNGYRLRYCITADDELNEAVVYDTDENGDLAIDASPSGGLLTMRIEGDIEIRRIE